MEGVGILQGTSLFPECRPAGANAGQTTKVSLDLVANDGILPGTEIESGRGSEVQTTRVAEEQRKGCEGQMATTVDEVEVPHREVGPTIRIQNSEFRMHEEH